MSLAFVRGIHRGPVNSPHKWPVTRKIFPFDDVIMYFELSSRDSYTVLNFNDSLLPVHHEVVIQHIRPCAFLMMYKINSLRPSDANSKLTIIDSDNGLSPGRR